MRKRVYDDYVRDILDAIDEVIEFAKGLELEQLRGDRKTINAIIRSLEVAGEAAKNVPAALRKKYPDIPWKKMTGMRNKLIHEYFGIDIEILWKVVKEDLPAVRPSVEKMLIEMDGEQ